MKKGNPKESMKSTVKHRKCVICGMAFDVMYPHFRQKTCSAECRKENNLHRNKLYDKRYYKSHKPKNYMHPQRIPCKRCGKEFTALYTQKYCEDCLNAPEWYMERLKENRKVM